MATAPGLGEIVRVAEVIQSIDWKFKLIADVKQTTRFNKTEVNLLKNLNHVTEANKSIMTVKRSPKDKIMPPKARPASA